MNKKEEEIYMSLRHMFDDVLPETAPSHCSRLFNAILKEKRLFDLIIKTLNFI